MDKRRYWGWYIIAGGVLLSVIFGALMERSNQRHQQEDLDRYQRYHDIIAADTTTYYCRFGNSPVITTIGKPVLVSGPWYHIDDRLPRDRYDHVSGTYLEEETLVIKTTSGTIAANADSDYTCTENPDILR